MTYKNSKRLGWQRAVSNEDQRGCYVLSWRKWEVSPSDWILLGHTSSMPGIFAVFFVKKKKVHWSWPLQKPRLGNEILCVQFSMKGRKQPPWCYYHTLALDCTHWNGGEFNSRLGFEKDELQEVSNRGASVHNWYEVSQQGRIRWLIIICLFSSLLNWYIVPGVITAWLLTSQISGMKHDTLIYNWLYGMSWFMKIDLYGEDEEILIFFFFLASIHKAVVGDELG